MVNSANLSIQIVEYFRAKFISEVNNRFRMLSQIIGEHFQATLCVFWRPTLGAKSHPVKSLVTAGIQFIKVNKTKMVFSFLLFWLFN